MTLQYAQAPGESYSVFDSRHAAPAGDIYAQYNSRDPYNNYYNYYNNASTVTNGAAAGNAANQRTPHIISVS